MQVSRIFVFERAFRSHTLIVVGTDTSSSSITASRTMTLTMDRAGLNMRWNWGPNNLQDLNWRRVRKIEHQQPAERSRFPCCVRVVLSPVQPVR